MKAATLAIGRGIAAKAISRSLVERRRTPRIKRMAATRAEHECLLASTGVPYSFAEYVADCRRLREDATRAEYECRMAN